MLSAPRVGSQAVIWYAAKRYGRKPGLIRSDPLLARLHGQIVTVLVSGRGCPRNHLVITPWEEAIVIHAGYLKPTRDE
jgi:hypothetical protein